MSHFALTVATSLGNHYPGFILSQCRINPPRPQEFLADFSSLSLLIFSLITYFLCGRSHFMFVLARKCRELPQMRQSQTLSWLFTPTSMHAAASDIIFLLYASHIFDSLPFLTCFSSPCSEIHPSLVHCSKKDRYFAL